MANLVKKIIMMKLAFLAGVYIRFKKIEIVAITGSAGKTTAKATIKQILPASLVYVPEEAYNTEYGVPLALFREKVPTNPKNLAAWTVVLLKMFFKLFSPAPFRRIVLEYGADKSGDISYLTSFAHPHIAIVTSVLPVHLEGFGTVEAVAAEKSKLVECLHKEDFAILNSENEYVLAMAEVTKARVLTVGQKGASLGYSLVRYDEKGMSLNIYWKNKEYQVKIPVLAPQLLPSYLSALALGLILGENPKDLVERLASIKSERGRMNILPGINESTIIDDSYNSNPESAKAALRVLEKFSGRKIAVLGSMNELGDYSKKGHTEVGELAAEIADELLVVGEVAGKYLYSAAAKSMNKNFVHKFASSKEAGEYLRDKLKKGDVILFKGSQNGVFTEEAVKSVLFEPQKAADLLVRQGLMWQNKKGKLWETL